MGNRLPVISIVLLGTLGLITACAGSTAAYRRQRAAAASISGDLKPSASSELPIAPDRPLVLSELIAAVLDRNPSVQAARQAWRGALARYPQETSYEDPMLALKVAPLSIVSSEVRVGFSVEASQRLPYFGKRRLRGEVILAEAEAEREDITAVQQRLALMATHLFFDYYLVEQKLAINTAHQELLTEIGSTVELHMVAQRAWQEDALQIDVDAAELDRQRVVLETERELIIAQLNALLHRDPDLPLPAPEGELSVPTSEVVELAALFERAAELRSELRANRHRTRGAMAELELADRNYYPDLRVSGSYNRMWPMLEHQIMVGLAVDLPFGRARRGSAEDAARARIARTEASRGELEDRIRLQITTAHRRAAEADRTATLYRDRVLPATHSRLEAVRLGLDAGRTGFVEVIRAERELRDAELRYQMALADSHRFRAEMQWAVGELPGGKQ